MNRDLVVNNISYGVDKNNAHIYLQEIGQPRVIIPISATPLSVRNQLMKRLHISILHQEDEQNNPCHTYNNLQCTDRLHRCHWDPIQATCNATQQKPNTDPLTNLIRMREKEYNRMSRDSLKEYIILANTHISHLPARDQKRFTQISKFSVDNGSKPDLVEYIDELSDTIQDLDLERQDREGEEEDEDEDDDEDGEDDARE